MYALVAGSGSAVFSFQSSIMVNELIYWKISDIGGCVYEASLFNGYRMKP